jgi:NitT/TauT family transport system substrate-binding protein
MKTRRFISWVALFLISITVAISCTPSQDSGSSTSGESINVGYSVWPGWLPWQVAQVEKLFDKNKVNVNLQWFDGYLDSINDFAEGNLDANCQTLNDTIASVAAGADQVVVLVNDNSTGNDQIIVSDQIKTKQDLKGKKIAVEQGTVDHFLLLRGLQEVGLTSADFEFVAMETGAAADAFVAGRVDAVGVFAPFTTKALLRPGSKVLFSSRDYPGAIPDHLVVSRQLVTDKPEVVQAMVDSWFDTLAFIESNKDRAIEIMAERAGVTVDEYQEYNEGTMLFSADDNIKAFSSGSNMASLQFAAQEISKFLVESKLIEKAPQLDNLFDDQFVKAHLEKASLG